MGTLAYILAFDVISDLGQQLVLRCGRQRGWFWILGWKVRAGVTHNLTERTTNPGIITINEHSYRMMAIAQAHIAILEGKYLN